MFNEIKLSRKTIILLKIIISISCPFLTLLFLRNGNIFSLIISFVLSFIIGILLNKYIFKNLFNKIDVKYLLLAFFIGMFIAKGYYVIHTDNMLGHNLSYQFDYLPLPLSNHLITTIVSFLSLPAIITFIYWLLKLVLPAIKNFYLSCTRMEKRFITVTFIASFFLTMCLYYFTNAFYNGYNYDVIFTSDSAAIFRGDAFFNINMDENDLRQPLFGLFAMPFAVIAKFLSELFFFVPNGYATFLTVIQIMLLNISILLLVKLLKLEKNDKFYFILLYLCSFSTVIFSFIMEQYIISFFYVILTIYIFFNNKDKVNYAYLGAVSTLLTSGVLFPFISKFKNWKSWLVNAFKCFICFVVLVIIFGQLPQIIDSISCFNRLLGFSGKDIDFYGKLIQYVEFVKNIFIAPATVILTEPYPNYALAKISNFSIIGIIILIICFISSLINRKNKMANIASLWVLFSFGLLCLFGWGTSENGLILYSLYFSWAFIILIYLFITKIIKNATLKKFIFITLCLIMVIVNIPEFINIINFGIHNYPN